ncbi:MAG TPA: cytochrome c biogenesis protein CcmE [Syntrophus sp. (in: bacteria)]|jgi:cytochrome c-type biogenesis protein CcmE|nr:cytochrome c biogenesis protein CcmE [Syntrophus sp. (in: bacteria)]
MKRTHLFALAGIVVFAALGFWSFRKTLTPYVPFEQAMRSPAVVQVAGTLVENTSAYTETDRTLRFTLRQKDGTAIMPVTYNGVKPSNFEEATSIVAIGAWDGTAFHARQLLVKCPSKYQDSGTERTY